MGIHIATDSPEARRANELFRSVLTARLVVKEDPETFWDVFNEAANEVMNDVRLLGAYMLVASFWGHAFVESFALRMDMTPADALPLAIEAFEALSDGGL